MAGHLNPPTAWIDRSCLAISFWLYVPRPYIIPGRFVPIGLHFQFSESKILPQRGKKLEQGASETKKRYTSTAARVLYNHNVYDTWYRTKVYLVFFLGL